MKGSVTLAVVRSLLTSEVQDTAEIDVPIENFLGLVRVKEDEEKTYGFLLY